MCICMSERDIMRLTGLKHFHFNFLYLIYWTKFVTHLNVLGKVKFSSFLKLKWNELKTRLMY